MEALRRTSNARATSSGRSHQCTGAACALQSRPRARRAPAPLAALNPAAGRRGPPSRRELVQQVRQQSQRLREHLSQLSASPTMGEAAPLAEVLQQLRSLDHALSTLEAEERQEQAAAAAQPLRLRGRSARGGSSSSDSDSGDEGSSTSTAASTGSSASSSSDDDRAMDAAIGVDADVLSTAVAMFGPFDSPLRGRAAAGGALGRRERVRRGQLLVHMLGGSMALDVPALDPPAPAAPPVLPADARGCVMVCQGKKCARRGAGALMAQAEAASADAPGVEVVGCKCLGRCKEAPAMRVKAAGRDGTTYARVQPDALPQLLDRHFAAQEQQ